MICDEFVGFVGSNTGKPEILIKQREKPDLAEMIENVICFIGRIYVCDGKCSESSAMSMKNCRGTVGLVGSSGETIGCWHTIEEAANKRALQRMFIEYPNYPKPLVFEAQIKDNLVSSDLDLFVAEPCEPLSEETAHLSSALDVSLADNVHCFGFPEIVDHELMEGYSRAKREQRQRCSKNELQRKLKLPTVFSGRVCFNGWKQAVADYLCFPNSSGGIVVDDYGCLKGVHVAAYRVGKTVDYHNLRIAKGSLQSSLTKLQSKLNEFCTETAQCLNSCKSEIATFVPVHIIEEPLQLSRLRLIRWKQPHQTRKRDYEQYNSAKPCLIRPPTRIDPPTKPFNATVEPPARKKLRSEQQQQQPFSNRNPDGPRGFYL